MTEDIVWTSVVLVMMGFEIKLRPAVSARLFVLRYCDPFTRLSVIFEDLVETAKCWSFR